MPDRGEVIGQKAGNAPSEVVLDTGFLQVNQQLAHPAGSAVLIEDFGPSNGDALYTVPIGKTFTGKCVIVCQGATTSSIALNAATGGVQAKATGVGASAPAQPTVVGIQIAGGGAGNALTVVTTGTPGGTIAISGYVK